LAALAAANRDPDAFRDPDHFDPDRDVSEALTFGFGSKHCPGAHLGTRQLLAALEVILERLPGLRLVEASKPSGAILRTVERLEVAWDRAAATRRTVS
jgi:cytochrome P450